MTQLGSFISHECTKRNKKQRGREKRETGGLRENEKKKKTPGAKGKKKFLSFFLSALPFPLPRGGFGTASSSIHSTCGTFLSCHICLFRNHHWTFFPLWREESWKESGEWGAEVRGMKRSAPLPAMPFCFRAGFPPPSLQPPPTNNYAPSQNSAPFSFPRHFHTTEQCFFFQLFFFFDRETREREREKKVASKRQSAQTKISEF